MSDQVEGGGLGPDDQQAERWVATLRVGSPDEKAAARRSLAAMFEKYQTTFTAGAKEKITRRMEDVHIKHLTRLVGGDTSIGEITVGTVQQFIDARSGETYKGYPRPVRARNRAFARDCRPIAIVTRRLVGHASPPGSQGQWSSRTQLAQQPLPKKRVAPHSVVFMHRSQNGASPNVVSAALISNLRAVPTRSRRFARYVPPDRKRARPS